MDIAAQKRAANEHSAASTMRVDFSAAWSCSWEKLARYQITPNAIVDDDCWVIPKEWCPVNRRAPSSRTINFAMVVPDGLDPVKAEGLKRRLKRLAILDYFQPVQGIKQTLQPPTPQIWVKKCQVLIAAARYSLETFAPEARDTLCPDGPTLFASVPEAEFRALKLANSAWGSGNIQRLNGLFADGYFDDWPSADVARHRPRKREGSKASHPFNDMSFTQILRAALWLNGIEGDVVDAYLCTKDIRSTVDGEKKSSRALAHRRERVRSWASATLQPRKAFPFDVTLSGEKKRVFRYATWPLDTVAGLKSLLSLCQAANAILILASTGMRIGELTALTLHGVLRRDERLYLTGRSFKDTDATDGQEREWPFPQAAVVGFEAQIDLSRTLGNEDRLWVSFGGENNLSGVARLDSSLAAFGKAIALPGGQCLDALDGCITPHRFRYSVSRYVALSLTGASQILFDVLGHDDKEVTLGYALKDPELFEDINKIRREVKAIRVKEVFDHAEQNGGPAGETVGKLKTDMLTRSGKAELDTDDLAEGAAILGETELVKPGVLCTAQPLERGACSLIPGVRDVGACSSACTHHLELAAHRQTRARNLHSLLEKIDGADLGVRIFYQGQIIANLNPFPDLIGDFETDPRLRAALCDCDPRTWGGLQAAVRERLDRVIEVSR